MKIDVKQQIVISIVLIVIVFLTIGFSAFQDSLFIDSAKVTYRAIKDIRVTGVSIDSVENGGVSNYEDYNVNNIHGAVNLPNENSIVKYKVEVTNFGNVLMGIYEISNIPENIDIIVEDYVVKTKLCDTETKSKCTNGSKTVFYITLKYKEGTYNPEDITTNFRLDFDFQPIYTVEYRDIVNRGYPVEIINKDTLDITFTSHPDDNKIAGNVPKDVKVNMNGIQLNNEFTYDLTHRLQVPNVDGNIIINRVFDFNEKIIFDNTQKVNNVLVDKAVEPCSLQLPISGKTSDYPNKLYVAKEHFCGMEDDYTATTGNLSYYYRGGVVNNYVEFAGYYWRIIRINGDENIRMIYAGKKSEVDKVTGGLPLANGQGVVNTSTGNLQDIGVSPFNDQKMDNAYVGYMYGTPGSSTYEATHENLHNSRIKIFIDNWYLKSGLVAYQNQGYLGDSVFVNDRSLYTDELGAFVGLERAYYPGFNLCPQGHTSDPSASFEQINSDCIKASDYRDYYYDSIKGYGQNVTYYAAFYRIRFDSYQDVAEHYPALKSTQQNDRFTVNDTTIGNGKLTYPIATITTGEMELAGGTRLPFEHDTYLRCGSRFWAMNGGAYTRNGAMGCTMIFNGFITCGMGVTGDNLRTVRPVINISKEVMVQIIDCVSGDGTRENPYKLELKK
ncbi:MAG: hypothetical protein K2H20_01050 [Bacilli bacterium]|nr:hypothetical protein [Bacilli bacterium]